MKDVKIPAIKKELVSCKFAIKEVEINVSHFGRLRWNYVPIEGAYRFLFKELSYNTTKIDLMLLEYVKDCFISSNGGNALIDWTESFKLIKNEITTSRNVANREDAATRCFRVKNFLKILPTYEVLWMRKVWGIPSKKCPRCAIEEETWDHLWICNKNRAGDTESEIFKASLDEVLSQNVDIMDKDQKNQWKEDLWEVAATKSMIMGPENLIREITRGLINEKWWRTCKIRGQCKVLKDIFDVYLKKIQMQIWNRRCVETIESERQLGILKDLKRKKKRVDDGEEMMEKAEGEEKSENKKTRKKIKNIIKINLEENKKDDVFRLGIRDRKSWGSKVISNLVNT
ncbi:uncharacterized protein OCT59_013251 [Rhizophagus irregularis]|uniref:Uncharacterized protein n=2 Tax=Rhizophagus irregularis TaxID=588596 RepID=A0A015L4L8_RHIIW|nr:hypothetical protein GLOIN_2v113877 [Rhizophagus irregularis DAOM 181602=DAOM 197198]EXX67436.1 hypothetical protein RirG_114410 [Rhizophagus irregularis DAOM 197198w]POG70464.1 hypothetical protein GLOIN_2v113877 [Rhizophagus irregularis DAOM 181602=DAOM 197198]UZO20839.1 hypothetical protein OCT59_013251 [Rhizophagus irregularis]|eukprot:XP_025177330.1 hypothetical protein GLOIN_2v113877 [Rhizophagus irregularis DAOM 181602=DAOM 197198]